MKKSGLIIINTGDGKGKTTAAVGQALRSAGHGSAVCVIQFIKGNWQTGEVKALESCGLDVELNICGTGFTWDAEDLEEVKKAGRKGWDLARKKIGSGAFSLIVLDELTYLVNYGIIEEEEVLAALKERPAGLDVVITGRNASEGLIEAADLVTEMKEIKHPYSGGVKARKGIEF